ncbi:MAG TPA: helix-turn-helix domain-containing protein [Cyclobacteriaceae bacterium]|nr:helix-turn-helix domain-containing protein [Cyclobacteriaceae bacterium]
MHRNPEKEEAFIRNLTEMILAKLEDEKFGITQLSEASGLSARKLRQRLHTATGKSISQFIREVRLRRASAMLENEEFTVSEIAYKTGFSSPTYFNTCFHEFFGYPPGSVRKRTTEIKSNSFPDTEKLADGVREKTKLERILIQRNKLTIGVFIFIIIALLAAGYFILPTYFLNNQKSLKKKGEISIAVLPFKNLSSNTDNQYFIDGIMEEILTNLSQLHNLRVVSRTSVEQFRSSSLSAQEMGKKLKVKYLVEGSGQIYDNKITLRVQLIEINKERHLWAESYEQEIREISDIFRIQSEVAQSIASELKITITPEEKQMMEKIPTASLSALDFYRRGFHDCLNNRYDKAKILFYKALEHDSTFALAYSGLFIVYKMKHYYVSYYSEDYMDSLLILTNKSLSFDSKYWPGYLGRGEYYILRGQHAEALRQLNKSLEINHNNRGAYYCLASINSWNNYYANYVKAIEYYQKALSVDYVELLPTTIYWIGFVYGNFAGMPEKAKGYYKKAFELEGDSIKYFNELAYLEMVTGHFTKSIEFGLKSYALDTNNRESLRCLGWCYLLKRQYQESNYYLNKLAGILKKIGEFQTSGMIPMGYSYLMAGNKKEAEYWFNEQKRLSEVSLMYGRWYSAWGYADLDLGIYFAIKGDKAKAFEHLQKFANGKVCPLFVITDLKYSPIYDCMRGDEEFNQFARNMEAKYLAEQARVKNWIKEQER